MEKLMLYDSEEGKEYEEKLKFPMDWFKEHVNEKPPVHLPVIDNYTLSTARVAAYGFMNGDRVPIFTVTNYLGFIFKDMAEELATTWESYKIKIGPGKITPLDLLEVTTFPCPIPTGLSTTHVVSDERDLYMLLIIFGVYRYTITDRRHQPTIAARLKKLANETKGTDSLNVKAALMTTNGRQLKENKAFLTLAAAFDMFCVKFPRNRFAKARFGTVKTRYMGCATLENVKYFAKILGGDVAHSKSWVFVPHAERELENLFLKKKEESAKIDSYFPYATSLGLIGKNPYSARSCPVYHLLVHVYGCLIQQSRSFNARYIETGSTIPIIQNACLAYLAKQRSKGLGKSLVTDREKEILTRIQAARDFNDQTNYGFDTSKALPLEWLNYFNIKNKGKFSEADLREIRASISIMPIMREKTVGNWVKTSLLSCLV